MRVLYCTDCVLIIIVLLSFKHVCSWMQKRMASTAPSQLKKPHECVKLCSAEDTDSHTQANPFRNIPLLQLCLWKTRKKKLHHLRAFNATTRFWLHHFFSTAHATDGPWIGRALIWLQKRKLLRGVGAELRGSREKDVWTGEIKCLISIGCITPCSASVFYLLLLPSPIPLGPFS